MSQSVLEMITDLVVAQIQSGTLSPEEMQEALRRVFQNLLELKSREELESPVAAASTGQALTDWRQSISRYAITCLECGRKCKQLSVRHLRHHDLDGRTYRAKYDIPKTQPLAARATTALRRRIAAEIRPWEKSPTYKKAQAKAAPAKKSGRKKGTRR